MKHVLRTLVIGAVAAVLAGCHTTGPAQSPAAQSPPPITGAVFFGDSLTDAGTYGFRFTTNPGQTWAQHIATTLGQPTEPNEHVGSYDDVYVGKPGSAGPGGLNYAEGGARAALPYSAVSQNPEGTPISTQVQLQHFVTEHGEFKPDQLVTLYVGTNDVALKYDPRFDAKLAADLRDNRSPAAEVMAAERTRIQQAATAEVQTATDMLTHGAQHLLVFKLFDLGVLPWFETQAARHYVSDLTSVYNEALVAGLPKDPRVHLLDTGAFVTDVLNNLSKYGFAHGANEDACAQPGQDSCGVGQWKEPTADRTYVFAASEHFTTHAHELLADYVREQADLR